MKKRLPWGHKSRHCELCGKVGPRTPYGPGWVHKRCLPIEFQREMDRENRRARRG